MNRDLSRSGEIVEHRCGVCGGPATRYLTVRIKDFPNRVDEYFWCDIHGPDKRPGITPVPLEQRRQP